MEKRTVSVTLSEPIYEQVRASAAALARPVEEILSQFIATAYPVLEDDLPPEMRAEFSGWILFSDEQLWGIAKGKLDEAKQITLENLVELQKHADLSLSDQSKLDQIMQESQNLLIYKAEAQRLLAQRGLTVYPKPNSLN